MGSQQFGEARSSVKPSVHTVGVAPLEVVAVEFPGYRFRGEVLAALKMRPPTAVRSALSM
jgi:hypothetical protein